MEIILISYKGCTVLLLDILNDVCNIFLALDFLHKPTPVQKHIIIGKLPGVIDSVVVQ